jgi:threonylcarbamoyladenosine tRNA methylthiotransferase MtaB
MGRHWYSAASYRKRVNDIARRANPFALSADVIAGFPGETDDDHLETLKLVEDLPFTSLHVFPYSPRPGTAATRLPGNVDSATTKRRAKELRSLAQAKTDAHMRARAGKKCDVVVVERGKGLTEDYLSVSVDPSIARRSRFDGMLSMDEGILTASPVTAG